MYLLQRCIKPHRTLIMAILLAPFFTKNRSINPSPKRDAGAIGMSCEMYLACTATVFDAGLRKAEGALVWLVAQRSYDER